MYISCLFIKMSWSAVIVTRSQIYMCEYNTLVFAVFYVRYQCQRYNLQVTVFLQIRCFYYQVNVMFMGTKHVVNGLQCYAISMYLA